MSLPAIRVVAVAAVLVGAAGAGDIRPARANGRAPATTSVAFQPDETERILLPVTFGLMISSDDGESFHWVCEDAIGYNGIFDPDYALTADGTIYTNSQKGLRVSRDGGCTFETVAGPLGEGENGFVLVDEVELGADGRIWATTATGGGPNDVYVSSDGVEFKSSGLPEPKAWWVSLRTTPADMTRIYVSGLLPKDGSTPPAALLRRSDDRGMNWEELPVDGFEFGKEPDLFIVGVSPMDEKVVFARVAKAIANVGDVLYRSGDSGATWAKVAEFDDTISAFLIRPDGQTVIAASVRACPEDITDAGVPIHGCVRISHDGGESWERAEQQPRLACIGERSDGVLFGCGANFDPDNFALGRSQDGETWDQVFRFEDTLGPLECGADTTQTACAQGLWQSICRMADACPFGDDAGPVAEDDGGGVSDSGGGCCRVTGGSDVSWLPGLMVVLASLAWWGRRRPRGPD